MDKNRIVIDGFKPLKIVASDSIEDYNRYRKTNSTPPQVYVFVVPPPSSRQNKLTELSKVLTTFKTNMAAFCNEHPGVHSAWILVDHNHKNITVFTVTGDWDFDLEGEIFSGPYSKLPVVTPEGYYIEQRVSFLDDDNIEDVVPSGYEPICAREK